MHTHLPGLRVPSNYDCWPADTGAAGGQVGARDGGQRGRGADVGAAGHCAARAGRGAKSGGAGGAEPPGKAVPGV